MGHAHYRDGFKVTLHPDALDLPLRWKRSQAIFVNSMSDLYPRDVPLSFILKVFATMHRADWHRYQILTKRAERLAELEGTGLVDVVAWRHPEGGPFSWWDYRMLGFPRNHGLRIDLVLASPALADRCVDAFTDRDQRKGEKPSDHAPVVVTFQD